jgi:hypothetical protein
MSTITVILEPDPDGSLHLPLPPELRQGKIKVVASMEQLPATTQPARPGLWKVLPGKFWMSADFDAPLEDFQEYME